MLLVVLFTAAVTPAADVISMFLLAIPMILLYFIAGLIALLFMLLPLVPGLGQEINGARQWIRIGPYSFQPVELTKICLAIFFAGYSGTSLRCASSKYAVVRIF